MLKCENARLKNYKYRQNRDSSFMEVCVEGRRELLERINADAITESVSYSTVSFTRNLRAETSKLIRKTRGNEECKAR